MSHAPLPQPHDPIRVEALADVLSSIIEENTATYVSAPITSGRRFLKWFKARVAQLDHSGLE
jgi:hypothetical protein